MAGVCGNAAGNHRLGVGDEIIAAGQAQILFDSTGRRVLIVDRQHRPRWHPIWQDNPAIIPPAELDDVDHDVLLSAPHARPYIVYPFTADTGWTFNHEFRARDHIARIYLTDQELALGRKLAREFGPYILIEPWSKHPNLRWPWELWVDLVALLPDLVFVQHTHRDSQQLIPGAIDAPTYSFREACGVAASAAVYVRGESGMVHAAAALSVDQITIWGGCMDWEVMGGYPGQTGVGIVHPPCGRYLPCEHCRTIMGAIPVETVATALLTRLNGVLGQQ